MEILYRIGYAVCHQLPERTIFIDGKQLPVCARCIGIYIGSLISIFFILFSKRRKSNAIPVRYISFTFVFLMCIMAIDGVTSYFGIRETTNSLRLLTGLSVGIPLPFFIYPILMDNLSESSREEQILKSGYELILLILLAIVSYLLIFHFNTKIYYPIALLTGIGIFSLHYLLLVTIFSLIFYNFEPKMKILKPFLIFLSGFILFFIEFITLTKLHTIINQQ